MNDIQREERSLRESEQAYGRAYNGVEKRGMNEHVHPQFAAILATATARPCEDCGGTGLESGSLQEWEPEDCRACHGGGEELDPLERLTLQERLVASIAVAMFRKGRVA